MLLKIRLLTQNLPLLIYKRNVLFDQLIAAVTQDFVIVMLCVASMEKNMFVCVKPVTVEMGEDVHVRDL